MDAKRTAAAERLAAAVEAARMETPARLGVKIVRLTRRLDPQGDQVRYMRAYAADRDVTADAAAVAGRNVSRQKGALGGCAIVHGSGMDMCLAFSSAVARGMAMCGHGGVLAHEYEDAGGSP